MNYCFSNLSGRMPNGQPSNLIQLGQMCLQSVGGEWGVAQRYMLEAVIKANWGAYKLLETIFIRYIQKEKCFFYSISFHTLLAEGFHSSQTGIRPNDYLKTTIR